MVHLKSNTFVFSKGYIDSKALKLEETIRDVNQSLFGGTLSADQMIGARAHSNEYGISGTQIGGGTFFHVPMMQGRDPWEEMDKMGAAHDGVKSILLRGESLIGYAPQDADVIDAFVEEAVKTGVNTFTVFDGFNDVDNVEAVIKAVKVNGSHARGVICIGDNDGYTLDHYKETAHKLEAIDVDSFYLKDPVGVSDPRVVHDFVSWLKDEFPQKEVHVHAHDSHGQGLDIYEAAIRAGVDVVDVGPPALSGNTAQVSAFDVVDMLAQHPDEEIRSRAPAINREAMEADSQALSALRFQYRDLEPAYDKGVFDAMKRAKAPGGAATAIRPMFEENMEKAIGLNWRDAQIAIYTMQEKLLPLIGDPLQVTPHAKNTTTQAALMVMQLVYDPDLIELRRQGGSSAKILNYIQDKIGNDAAAPEDSFVFSSLQASMTDDMAGTLAGKLGRMPGKAHGSILNHPKVLEQKEVLAAASKFEADGQSVGALGQAERRLAEEGVENASRRDVVTAALRFSRDGEGIEHVQKNLSGNLIEKSAPELPGYAVQMDGGAIPLRNGVMVASGADVVDAMGGVEELSRIAILASEVSKLDFYLGDGDEDTPVSNFYKVRASHQQDELNSALEEIPQKLYEAGFDKMQLVGALNKVDQIMGRVVAEFNADDGLSVTVPRDAKIDRSVAPHSNRYFEGLSDHSVNDGSGHWMESLDL